MSTHYRREFNYMFIHQWYMGWIVNTLTCYGLDGMGIKFPQGQIFHIHPDWPWDPPSLLYEGC